MKKKIFIAVILCAALVLPSLLTQNTVYADQQNEETVVSKGNDSYLSVSLLDLLSEEMLTPDETMKETNLSTPEEGNGVLISGPVAELNSGKILLGREFVFDGNPVGRISLNGIAEPGAGIKVKVYLDAENEPLAVIPLDSKSKREGWNVDSEVTVNVYDRHITGTHTVSFGFEVSGMNESQKTKFVLNSVEFVEDPGIPTIYVNIDESQGTIEDMNSSANHSVRCYGSIDIRVPEGFQSEYQKEPAESLLDLKLEYIRGRGNSTWITKEKKKPYKIKLDKKQDLFGMGKNAHYALLANRFDNSLVRNRMTYWLTGENGLKMEYAPQCVPVDVVMNGSYLGSYLLCENIRIGEGRVEIDKLKEKDTELPDITGGYLLSLSPYGHEDSRSVFNTERNEFFVNEEPDFVEYENAEQTNYIRGYVQATENAIFGENYQDPEGKSYTDYLDLASAIDYWWVQELSMNGDAYKNTSTYMYKKRSGKLFWGPLWDFDYVAWGDLEPVSDLRNEGLDNTSMSWFNRLLDNPDFTGKLAERWKTIDGLLTEIVKENGILDQYYEQTRISERYDNEKYGFFHQGFGEENTGEEETEEEHTYKDEIDQLRAWVSGRQAWINEHIDDVHHLVHTVNFVVDDQVVYSARLKGMLLNSGYPEEVEKEGRFFKGWFTEPEGGMEMDPLEPVKEDCTYYAQFLTEEEVTKATELYIEKESDWVSLEDENYGISYLAWPNDAMLQTVTWVSSDESVATVDEMGFVTPLKEGKVTVTGTLQTGVSASIELTVYDPAVIEAVPVEKIEPEHASITVGVGEHVRNKVILYPQNAPLWGNHVYFSEEEGIVSFEDGGLIFGLSPGTATVTMCDSVSGITNTFEVTVIDREEQEKQKTETEAALALVKQLNSLVKKSMYTAKSYAVYQAVVTYAADRLRNRILTTEEIQEILKPVFAAQLALEKKAANTLKVAGKTAKVKANGGRLSVSKVLRFISKGHGKRTYAKLSGNRKITINSRTGKVTVKKGLKKGTYNVKMKVTAAGNGNYKAGSRTVTFKLKVQ